MKAQSPVANALPKMHKTPLLDYQNKLCLWMERKGYAETTTESYGRQISYFLEWLQDQKISELSQVEQSDLENYTEHLHRRKNQIFGGALSSSYIQSHINTIRLLDKYLQLTGEAKILKGKLQVEKGLQVQRTILSQSEIKQLYDQTEDNPMGLRDRAVFGIYYGCGLRSTEGIRVEIKHIQYEKNLLYVLPGKNGRSRQVPISEKVKRDFKDYEIHGRKYLLKQECNQFLVSYFGGKMKRGCSFNPRLKQLVEKAGINKEISLHCLRHSIATHLLQQGMPLDQISRFLGHTSLDSTQIYTRIVQEMEDERL